MEQQLTTLERPNTPENGFEEKEAFIPYEKTYKCANKDCLNTWNVLLTEPLPILMCGGGDKVCSTCSEQGYKICSGSGNGMFYLYKNGEQVAVYDYKTAYKIKYDENHVENCILKSLAEGYSPVLTDTYSKELLRSYVKMKKDWEMFEKDEYGTWYAPEWTKHINTECDEAGLGIKYESLHGNYHCVNPNTLYFLMSRDNNPKKYILSFDLETFEMEFNKPVHNYYGE